MAVDITNHLKKISGKDYLMVAGRVILAHDDTENITIETEFVPELSDVIPSNGRFSGYVTFKATVTTPKGTFTGYSTASSFASGAEGDAPVEVAETSAVGRALGFAGYGTDYGIASAEEMFKVGKRGDDAPSATPRSNTRTLGQPQNRPTPQAANNNNGSGGGDSRPIDAGRKRAIQNISNLLSQRDSSFSINAMIAGLFDKNSIEELTISDGIRLIEELNKILSNR